MFSKENIRIENATSRDTTVAGCLSEAGIPPSSPWCNPALLRGGVYIRDSDDSDAV
jgi:hypothetical protein